MLHLAILPVLGTRRMVAQRLIEATLQRMQDPTEATLLAGFLNDLLLMLP